MHTYPYFESGADRMAWARRRYFDDGLRPTGIVGEAVIQSWQRCLSAGLQPDQLPTFEPVTRARASQARARSHALLDTAASEVDQLERMLAGAGCRAILADGQGIVLRATSPAPGGRSLLDIATRVGVDLSEGCCGSTAPTVSVASGHACTVSGAEHFFGSLRRIWCAAAPIRDTDGTLVGVLDLSVEDRPFGFDALGIVRLAATAIENRLAVRQAQGHVLLRLQIAPGLLGTPMEGLALVDGRGALRWMNTAAQALVGSETADVEHALGLDLERLLAHGAEPRPWRLPNGLEVWLAVTPPGRGHEPPLRTVEPPSLDDVHRRHIEATLRDCRGNVAAAARRLGVSRGLLYRRMKAWGPPGEGG